MTWGKKLTVLKQNKIGSLFSSFWEKTNKRVWRGPEDPLSDIYTQKWCREGFPELCFGGPYPKPNANTPTIFVNTSHLISEFQ